MVIIWEDGVVIFSFFIPLRATIILDILYKTNRIWKQRDRDEDLSIWGIIQEWVPFPSYISDLLLGKEHPEILTLIDTGKYPEKSLISLIKALEKAEPSKTEHF